jgi:hypothetical protein
MEQLVAATTSASTEATAADVLAVVPIAHPLQPDAAIYTGALTACAR